MAIDTEAKRASSAAIAVIGMAVLVPDGNDLEAPQRLAANGLYLGIEAGLGSVVLTSQPRIHIGLGLNL